MGIDKYLDLYDFYVLNWDNYMIKDAILVSLVLILELIQRYFILDKSLNILFRLANKWTLEAIELWKHLGWKEEKEKKLKKIKTRKKWFLKRLGV